MTGVILISAGLIIIVTGIIILFNSKKERVNLKEEKQLITEVATEDDEITVSRDEIHRDDIDSIIELAIVDGVLTNNEKEKIKEIAKKNNLNYDSIIQETILRLQNRSTPSETELIDYNYKNGLDFEKYIVQKFDKRYFAIKNWAGDKYVAGRYAETTPEPDILFEFKLNEEKTVFSVECKWRKDFYNEGVEIASKEQFENYKNYERSKNIPVFIAIGIGGSGENPSNVYMVPLRFLKYNFVKISYLNRFKKKEDRNFYFDIKKILLY